MGLLDRPGQSQRYGLLSPDVMSLIQSGGPRVPQAPAAPRRERVSGWRVLDRVLGGQTISEGLDAERARPAEEAARRQKQQVLANLMGMFGGGAGGGLGAPAGGMPPIALAGGVPGAQPGAAAAAAPARRGLPSLRDAAPILMAGELAGIDGMGSIRETLEAVQPDIDFVNGLGVDRRDPANVGRRHGVNLTNVNGFQVDPNDPANTNRYLPDIPEGAMPLYDENRNIVAIRNIDGAVQAVGERERATADAGNASRASYAGVTAGAEAAARAPYQFVNVTGADGQPVTMSAASAAGGVFQGQSPSDAIRAEGTARSEVEAGNVSAQRARAAPERIQRYEEALRLIPKAITGFGADARLVGARALAAGGNQDAREAVAATEVYQNLIGRDIGAIVRDMVGAANISNSDRELATRIAGGDTNITPQALTRIVNYELSRQTRYLAESGQPLSPAEARRLPSGTEFTGTDGQRYRAP